MKTIMGRENKFEVNGVGFQDRAYTVKEATKRMNYSCEMCQNRFRCESCKIATAHKRAIAEILAKDPYRVSLKETAMKEKAQRRAEFLASKGIADYTATPEKTRAEVLAENERRLKSRLIKTKCISTSVWGHNLGKLGDVLYYDPATLKEKTQEAKFYELKPDGSLRVVGILDIKRFKEC